MLTYAIKLLPRTHAHARHNYIISLQRKALQISEGLSPVGSLGSGDGGSGRRSQRSRPTSAITDPALEESGRSGGGGAEATEISATADEKVLDNFLPHASFCMYLCMWGWGDSY